MNWEKRNNGGKRTGIKSAVATVEFLHFCDLAFLDKQDRPCLIGVLLSLYSTEFPFTYPSLTVVAGLRLADQEQAKITIELGPPNGPRQRWSSFRIQSRTGLVFVPFQTVALHFREPQIVEARVVQDDQTIHRAPLHVVKSRHTP
jgi:hypothetical protein